MKEFLLSGAEGFSHHLLRQKAALRLEGRLEMDDDPQKFPNRTMGISSMSKHHTYLNGKHYGVLEKHYSTDSITYMSWEGHFPGMDKPIKLEARYENDHWERIDEYNIPFPRFEVPKAKNTVSMCDLIMPCEIK